MWARDYGALFVAWGLVFGCGGKSSTVKDGDEGNDAGEGNGGSTSGGPQGGSIGKGGCCVGKGGSVGKGGNAGKAGSTGKGGAPTGGTAGTGDAGQAGEGASGAGGTGGEVVCFRPEPVVITSEADLRAFAALGCEVLEGSLTIQSPTLRTMDALGQPSVLRVITGDLAIQQNPVLENIEGFLGLERIDGSLIVTSSTIETLQGLESLGSVGTNPSANALIIAQNPRLLSVNQLHSAILRTNLTVAGNDSLLTTDGIDGLASTSSVTITNNAALEETQSLSVLEDCDSFVIASNPSLVVVWLPVLTIVGSLTITSNGSLEAVSLPRLERAEYLTIAGNNALTTLGTLDALTSVGMLVIAGNPMFPQCFVDELDLRLQACNMSCGGNDTSATCN